MGDPSKYTEATDTTDIQDPNSSVQMTQAQFAAAIGSAVAQGIAANKGPEKVTVGQYMRVGKNGFHPEGYGQTPKMNRLYLQNGSQIAAGTSHDDEIRLLNRITHSGRYLDRMVEVVVNNDSADESVDIRFSNTLASAFELKGKARDFREMLKQIVDAQEMEDLEREERESTHKAGRVSVPKQFGNSKATQAAYDAANKK